MKLEEIKEVFQTADYVEVNDKIKTGYKILKILSSKVKTMETETISPMYVLAK